jgi:hypothetical protein
MQTESGHTESQHTESSASTPATSRASKIHYKGPIWTLVLLAPLIAEVLSGSTRLSFLFAYIPETMVWGCGALLCRELVRRWRAGTTSLLLLGLALSVAEEFVIQQTSLAPLPFPGANAQFGRLFGVNWIYFLFMLGYESVWVTVVPVTITELIFSARRSQPWLRKGGLITTCIVFPVGCYIAWFAWTQRAVPALHFAKYHPPVIAVASGVAAILLLGLIAYALRSVGGEMAANSSSASRSSSITSSLITWATSIAAFVLGCAWFKLIAMVFTPVQAPAWLPMVAGFAGGLCSYALFRALSSGSWGDMQRWAASFGAVMACMGVEYLSTVGWKHADLVFKAIVNVLAMICLLWLGVAVSKRKAGSAA